MAEALVSVPVELNPEAPEFVQRQSGQPNSRRGRPRADHGRRWGGHDRLHPQKLGHSDPAGHPVEQHGSHDNPAVSSDDSSARHETRGGRGRGGRRGHGNRNSDRWPQGPRWSWTTGDNGQDRGSNRDWHSDAPSTYTTADGENEQRASRRNFGGNFQHDPRENWPQKSMRGRGERAYKGPTPTEKDTHSENNPVQAECVNSEASLEHPGQEQDQRNQNRWRGGGRWPNPRKKGPALHSDNHENWREREQPQKRGEEEGQRDEKRRGGKEEVIWRGGSGRDQGKGPRMQEEGQINEKGRGGKEEVDWRGGSGRDQGKGPRLQEEGQRGEKGRGGKEKVNWRGGSGRFQGKGPRMQEEGQRGEKRRGGKEEVDWRGGSGTDQVKGPRMQEEGQRDEKGRGGKEEEVDWRGESGRDQGKGPRMQEEGQRDEKGRGGKKEVGERSGSGRDQGKRPRVQEQSQRRAGGMERRTGPVKRVEPIPKSKETQTGCLIEQLTEEKYECMVCCDVIRLMAPVWSCQSCFHVFHLNCIKKWARSPASQADVGGDGWRCPACQNVALKPPVSYTCFCGKVINPEYQRSEIPHSCGDVCGKKRAGVDCNHPCNILCHPGPCPQCPAFVTKSCICGRTSKPVRCSQTDALRCEQVCGALLNCSEHRCSQICHQGPCQPCQLRVQQVCYCGVVYRDVACGTDRDVFDGSGHFSCNKPCGRMLDCKAHRCQQMCHPGQCQPCPRSPRLVRTCPCGQTRLAKLLELGYPERRSCADPVPSCGMICSKPLPCGDADTVHFCDKLCHEDSCGPCSLTSTIKCRCGSKTKEVPCTVIQSEEELVFTCEKRCSKKRSCGRHKCGELCCVDTEHKCTLICGYKLNCGQHRCQEVCHRGNCQPCWQTSFDELACYCGETVMYPPVPCGTKPPECKKPCTRQHSCDHPVFHSCHSEETCPPCTYLTKKWCMGNHEQRSNIPCHLQDISCGLVCNKPLPCGSHRCKRLCHRSDCPSEGECKQPCTHPRPECGHPCNAPCHPGAPCPHTTCTAKVALQCNCGRKKETVPCPEAANSFQRYAAIAVATKMSDMQLGETVDIGQLTKKEQKQARLECDQECATLERNRRLAEALQIDQSVDPFNTKSSSKYSDTLKEDARKDFKFVSEVEEEIKNLVELANKGKQPRRSHSFPPMKREQRRIVHELAEVYGVESVSFDSEPKRNVVITAIRGKSACPNSTLTALIERETAARAPPPIAHIKQHSSKVDGSSAWPKTAKDEPSVDYFDVQD